MMPFSAKSNWLVFSISFFSLHNLIREDSLLRNSRHWTLSAGGVTVAVVDDSRAASVGVVIASLAAPLVVTLVG